MKVENFIDLERIAEIVQSQGLADCHLVPKEGVKLAVVKWLESVLDAIDTDPGWFIQHVNSKHFYNNLPEIPEALPDILEFRYDEEVA